VTEARREQSFHRFAKQVLAEVPEHAFGFGIDHFDPAVAPSQN
jgi:hypothetical protein